MKNFSRIEDIRKQQFSQDPEHETVLYALLSPHFVLVKNALFNPILVFIFFSCPGEDNSAPFFFLQQKYN